MESVNGARLPIFKLLHQLLFFFTFMSLALLSGISAAKSLYVTDKIAISIYPEPNSTTTPLKKIPSGTVVNSISGEKLSEESNFTQIETQDGIKGWIESKYLTNEKPTQIEYLQLAAKYKAAESKIADYETRLLDMQELRKEAKTTDWLRNQLGEFRKKEQAFEQQIKLKDIALADLRITIANLEEQLHSANIEPKENKPAVSIQPNLRSDLPEGSDSFTNSSSIRFYTWLVLSLAVTLIIGILLGFVMIDYRSRKKNSIVKEA